MSKPSPTKAFNESIFPLMELDGFHKVNTKFYIRLNDEILQWIDLDVDSRLRRSFRIGYGTMLRASPKDSFTKRIGGDFTRLSSGGSYGAFSDAALEKSIERVKVAYLEEVKVLLDNTYNVTSYLASIHSYIKDNPNSSNTGHEDFELACSYAILGEYSKAKKYASQAKEKYKTKSYDWAITAGKNAEFLEIECSQKETPILNMWKMYTDKSLKLKKIQKYEKT